MGYTTESSSLAPPAPNAKTQVLSYDSAAEAAAAGWDAALSPVPFLSTDWLDALGPIARGGAGGPSTQYVQVADARGAVRLQCLRQRLPVAEMRLGTRVRPEVVARVLGAEAHQLGQALFSGPAYATDLPPDELALAFRRLPIRLGGRGAWFLKDCPITATDAWLGIDALPEMAIEMRPAWRDFGDYLAALPSKYRSRVRRARKKLGPLTMRRLSAREAQGFGESLQGLYGGLMARTPHAPYVVPDGYVPRLKALRPDGVTLLGYFDAGEMVGFATLLQDGDQALAHLAAVDPRYNPTHQLYLNVLLDLLEEGIRLGCARLNYGRTATTIKSSIGAKPVYYGSAVRHSGCLRHRLLSRIVPLVFDADADAALVQSPLG